MWEIHRSSRQTKGDSNYKKISKCSGSFNIISYNYLPEVEVLKKEVTHLSSRNVGHYSKEYTHFLAPFHKRP